jgi:hypothetical protein
MNLRRGGKFNGVGQAIWSSVCSIARGSCTRTKYDAG